MRAQNRTNIQAMLRMNQDLESRKEERLSEVERQRNIVMKPPKKVAQLEIYPDGRATRVFPSDYAELVEKYEHEHGRTGVKMFGAFALVDFYSERFNGEPIIPTKAGQHVCHDNIKKKSLTSYG